MPGSRIGDYLEVLRLARASPRDAVADCVDVDNILYHRLWQPFTRAVLNTDAGEASACLLWDVIAATFLKGEAACRPMLFSSGLTPTLVEPALRLIGARKSDIRFQARARGLRLNDEPAVNLMAYAPVSFEALVADGSISRMVVTRDQVAAQGVDNPIEDGLGTIKNL